MSGNKLLFSNKISVSWSGKRDVIHKLHDNGSALTLEISEEKGLATINGKESDTVRFSYAFKLGAAKGPMNYFQFDHLDKFSRLVEMAVDWLNNNRMKL